MPWWPWSIFAEVFLWFAALASAYRWARSPGMAALGFELIDARTGTRPNLAQCSIRAFFAVASGLVGLAFGAVWLIAGAPDSGGPTMAPFFLVPNAAFGILLLSYLPMRFTSRRQSLWDILTRTAVVQRARQTNETPVVAG